MSVLTIALLGAAVTLVPTSPDQPRQAEVQYSDLNLATEAGRDVLDRRLKIAVDTVCGRISGQTFREQVKIRKCQKRAIDEVGPQRALAIANSGVKLASDFER